MREDRINFSIIIRMALSLLPVFLGLPTVAVVMCAYNLAMSIILIGPVTGLVSSLSTVLLSMLFYGFIAPVGELMGLFLALEAIIMGVICAVVMLKGYSFYKGVWLSGIGYLAISFIEVMHSAHKMGQSVADYLTLASFEQIKIQFLQMIEQLQIGEKEIMAVFEAIRKITVMVIPSTLVLMSIIIGYTVMWCVNYFLRKIPAFKKDAHSFALLRMPKMAILFMILVSVLCFVLKSENIVYVLINVAVVFGGLSFFSGMSVVDFFLRKKIKAMFPRIGVHFLIYMLSGLITGIIPYANIIFVYVIIAMLDSFINFRRIKPSEEGESNEEE